MTTISNRSRPHQVSSQCGNSFVPFCPSQVLFGLPGFTPWPLCVMAGRGGAELPPARPWQPVAPARRADAAAPRRAPAGGRCWRGWAGRTRWLRGLGTCLTAAGGDGVFACPRAVGTTASWRAVMTEADRSVINSYSLGETASRFLCDGAVLVNSLHVTYLVISYKS